MRAAPFIVALGMLCAPALAGAALQVVVIEGLGGEARYAEQFATQVTEIERAAAGLTGADNIRVFRSGEFERDDVLSFFDGLDLNGDDRLAIYLIGHGSYDDHEYKFNIDGPDVSDTDLYDIVENTAAGSVLLVNTSSASGATRERLQGDGRTLILATRSGSERHATRFGGYFTAAFFDPSADLDKNQVISAAEAFQFAERQVSDFFERNGQLATEHPQLEGEQAARFSLARLGTARPVQGDTELERMIGRRDELNGDIESLQLRRESMAADAYQSELLGLMLELATLEEEIERRESEIADEN
jgi:hypothetical protein